MKNLLIISIGLGLTLVSFQNCSPAHNTGDLESLAAAENSAMLNAAASEILQKRCAECHSPASPVQTPLLNIMDIDGLVAGGYVVPGKPQNSRIYLDMIDGIMPKDRDPVSNSELNMIAEWLEDMGENNPDPTGGAEPDLGDIGDIAPITFAEVNGAVIGPRCLGCHSANNPRGGVNLDGYANVMNYVTPGSPNGSVLYTSVANNSMPTNGPLPTSEKTLIFNWIAQRAPQ